ncbi:uncharacterized protein [Cherax quadricarinatus]|uniref:uncharacterized protein n=1 Tax=Cherax quadricarinatus TaxID=27406 RepID=UPI00387EA04F
MEVSDDTPVLRGRMKALPVLILHSVMCSLVTETTLSLGIKNIIVVTTTDFDTYDVVRCMWALGVSTEVHLDSHYMTQVASNTLQAPVTDKDCSSIHNRTSLWSRVDWTFLYGREPLPRHTMAVLVVGPANWVGTAAVQLDTLMLAPVGGNILGRDLCPSIPLAVRVLLLEDQRDKVLDGKSQCTGVLREARLTDGGRYNLHTVACLQHTQLLHSTPLLSRPSTLKGGVIKIAYMKNTIEIILVRKGESLVLQELLGEMLTTIMKKLNFTIQLNEISGRVDKMSNGSYGGAIGTLQRREADVLMATMSMLPERATVLDYSQWFWLYNLKFYTKVPKFLEDKFLLMQIYTWQVMNSRFLGFYMH